MIKLTCFSLSRFFDIKNLITYFFIETDTVNFGLDKTTHIEIPLPRLLYPASNTIPVAAYAINFPLGMPSTPHHTPLTHQNLAPQQTPITPQLLSEGSQLHTDHHPPVIWEY